ncbi:MAG: hypothetical protein ACFFDH_00360 [Promethearchaeota archaeon]
MSISYYECECCHSYLYEEIIKTTVIKGIEGLEIDLCDSCIDDMELICINEDDEELRTEYKLTDKDFESLDYICIPENGLEKVIDKLKEAFEITIKYAKNRLNLLEKID